MKKLKIGFGILTEGLKFFFKHPKSIFPLLLVWGIYAPSAIYLYYYIDFSGYSTTEFLIFFFLYTFVFSLLISISSLILLELVEQLETTGEMSIFKAVKDAFTRDLIKTLPIILIWSSLVFIITIIEALINSRKNKNKSSRSREYSAKGAAEFLSGGGSFSFSSAFLKMLKKSIRGAVFVILPAIAWEELPTREATKKGLSIFRQRWVEMGTAIGLSQLVSLLLGIPIGIIFYMADGGVVFNDYVWYTVIIYGGFIWSYGILVEQLFSAEIYLWHMTWEKKAKAAQVLGEEVPSILTIRRPSFLDQTQDLLNLNSSQHYTQEKDYYTY